MPATSRQFQRQILLTILLIQIIGNGPTLGFADEESPVNFEQHIAPLLKQHCRKCHGDADKKAGLNFSTYASLMSGGSGGPVVKAGRASASLLFEAITNEDPEARMPPKNEPLPKREIELIRKWIDEGLRETAGNSVAAARKREFVPSLATIKSDGPLPLPHDLPELKSVPTLRPFPVIALAANPRSPLIVASGQDCVQLLLPDNENRLGALAFPEGEPHVLRFSRNGRVLLAAGGKPVQSGVAVLYDVVTGKPLAHIADEDDTILAADLSTDERFVAVGGSDRTVKAYSTEEGTVVWKITKHTDWITALAFSPDGQRLATADRAGGLHLWDARSGALLLSLNEHQGAISGLSWRSDSKVLASCSDEGRIVWWSVQDGWPLASKHNPHPAQRSPGVYGKIPQGVSDIAFGPNGELASCGRDGRVRLWNAEHQEIHSWGPLVEPSGLPSKAAVLTRVVISHDGNFVLAGDSAGKHYRWKSPEALSLKR